MSNRKAHTVYFSDDLRGRVDDMAEKSNLSRADIYDEALEFFFEHHVISPDGNLAYTNGFIDMMTNPPEGEREMLETILENQREMMESLEAPLPESENRDQNKNSEEKNESSESSEIDVRGDFDHLKGDYNHDECINPDDVDPSELTETRDCMLPVVTGVLNWKNSEENVERMEKSELLDMMKVTLDISGQCARNYLDYLLSKEIVIPHPCIDDDVVDSNERVCRKAASATLKYDREEIHLDSLSTTKQDRYVRDIDEYVGDRIQDWGDSVYYFDVDAYVRDVWTIIVEGLEKCAVSQMSESRPSAALLNEKERVYGLSQVVLNIYYKWVEVSGYKVEEFNLVVGRSIECDDEESVREWFKFWVEMRSEVKEEFGWVEYDNLSESEARDILGVDGEADEGEIKERWRDFVMENHPDQGGDIDEREFGEVKRAKDILLN